MLRLLLPDEHYGTVVSVASGGLQDAPAGLPGAVRAVRLKKHEKKGCDRLLIRSLLIRSDQNADLCATRYYHETLRAHGARSTLMTIPADLADSYCMGNSSNPAAAVSPYLDKTATLPPKDPRNYMGVRAQASPMAVLPVCLFERYPCAQGGCIDHTMGFADMVPPLTEFLLSVLNE